MGAIASASVPDIRVFRAGKPTEEAVDLDGVRGLLADEGAFVCVDLAEPTEEEVSTLQDVLGLHPLAVEDVQHRGQRSKVELYDDHVFVVLRPVSLRDDESLDRGAEVYAFGGPGFLATLRFGDGFDVDQVAKRWERQAALMSQNGGALYALIDEVVDGYLDAIEELEDEADRIEDEVFEDRGDGGTDLLERIFRVKRAVIRLRRLVVPLRQGVDLLQEDDRAVSRELAPYYRDVMDHVLRSVELADNVRDVLTSLLELRSGQIANRLSDVAKKLSGWAGIILVPTLIAGIYGMNFRHMPELDWRVGYPLALGLMAISAILLYRGFKKRGWL
jgi:magnesium transporter